MDIVSHNPSSTLRTKSYGRQKRPTGIWFKVKKKFYEKVFPTLQCTPFSLILLPLPKNVRLGKSIAVVCTLCTY